MNALTGSRSPAEPKPHTPPAKSKCHTGAPYSKRCKYTTEIAQQCISNFSTPTWSTLERPAHTFTHRIPINDAERISTSACESANKGSAYKTTARAQSADNRRAQRFFILKLNKITWKQPAVTSPPRYSLTVALVWLVFIGDRTWPYKAQGVAAPRESPAHPPPAHRPLACTRHIMHFHQSRTP